MEFKKQVDEHKELRKKSIPFVFFSMAADKNTIDEAYTKMTIQGFFQKADSYDETKNIVRTILEYWKI